MDFRIEPLPGSYAFGAVIAGLEPKEIEDERIRRRLYDLWIEEGVVVFKGLSDLRTQLDLSEILG